MASSSLLPSAMTLLRTVANALTFITTTKVHPTLFPYALAPVLHASRISLAFQNNVRAFNPPGQLQLPWSTYIAGYLIMAWGGTVLTHVLLSLPPPPLYSIHPYITYLIPHFILTLLYPILSSIPQSVIDTMLIPIDALLRANSVSMGLSLLSSTTPSGLIITGTTLPVDSRLINSWVTHAFIGAAASAGGGVSAGTLSVWKRDWTLGTPSFLRGAGWWATMDVWGGALVALIISTATAHPALSHVSTFIFGTALGGDGPVLNPALSPLGAKALGALVYGVLFSVRVYRNHWAYTPATAIPPTAHESRLVKNANQKGVKEKAQ